MKKKYINPELTIVTLNLERLIAQSVTQINADSITDFTMGNSTDTEGFVVTDADAREVVRSHGAWEEW